MELQDYMAQAYRTAREHGWWDEQRSFGDLVSLVHAELSEALEEYRTGVKPHEIWYGEGGKPEGVAVELADVLIRVFDMCEHMHIPLERALVEKMAWNTGRPYRHGNKVL